MRSIVDYISESFLREDEGHPDMSKYRVRKELTKGMVGTLNRGGRVKIDAQDILCIGHCIDDLVIKWGGKGGSMKEGLTKKVGDEELVMYEKFFTITNQGNALVVRVVKEKLPVDIQQRPGQDYNDWYDNVYTPYNENRKEEQELMRLIEDNKRAFDGTKKGFFNELIPVDEIKWSTGFVFWLGKLLLGDKILPRCLRVQIPKRNGSFEKGLEIGYTYGVRELGFYGNYIHEDSHGSFRHED